MKGAPEELRNAQGERLDFAWHPAHGGDSDAVVVIGHGVTGNKDRPFAQTLAEAASAAGLTALRFSFSGNGASEGDFRESTVTKEVDDLASVVAALAGRRVAYAGHSMGGAVGVLAAARGLPLTALVSLAGMVHTAEFTRRKFGELVPGRDTMWDKPECPLARAFVDDMLGIDTVLPQAERVAVPWLLVHGTADTVVPLQDSLDVVERVGAERAELVRLEGADHVFTAPHAERMAEAVVPWLRRQLGAA